MARIEVIAVERCPECAGNRTVIRNEIIRDPVTKAVIRGLSQVVCDACHGTGETRRVIATLPERAEFYGMLGDAIELGFVENGDYVCATFTTSDSVDAVLALLGLGDDDQ